MREHRLIFVDAPSESLPKPLRENIQKMGTADWKEEVKTAVRDDLQALKEKVQLEEAKKLIEAREGDTEEQKAEVAAEKKVLIGLIETRLRIMETISGVPGAPSGVPEPIRKELEAGITKAMAGAAGMEAAGKFLKFTPADGAREILRIVDLAYNKLVASIAGSFAKIPLIGDLLRSYVEKAQESIAMLEMQGAFSALSRELRGAKREVTISWNPEAWPKWKEAQKKSGKSAKEFARETAKKHLDLNPALVGVIDMKDIAVSGVAPAAPSAAPAPIAADKKDGAPAAAAPASPESITEFKDHEIDPLWGEKPRVVPASGVRMKLQKTDPTYCRIQDDTIFFEGGASDASFSIADLPENAQILFHAQAGDGLESKLSLRLNDVSSKAVTLREIKTMKDKISVSLGDRVVSITPAKRGWLS